MRRASIDTFVLAGSAALVLAAAPAFAGDDWAGRGDYGWGGFTGYGRGVAHEGYSPWGGCCWQTRVRRDGNAPYRAFNSSDGYRRYYYGYAGYGWGEGWGRRNWAWDCSYGCYGYGGYEGYGGYNGYRAAYRRYGGYWTRPSDVYYGGWGYWGHGRGWGGYDHAYVDEPCEPRTYGYHYGRTRC